MGEGTLTMRTVILLAACLALASGSARYFSKKALTPMSHGGNKIVGGEDAAPGEFPHQVMLSWGVGGGLMCGGSLVTSTKVITAGHCCDGQPVEDIGVVVANYIYDDWTVANDICVLDLDGEADLTSELIDVIALPEEMEEYEAGTECVCTGWGATTHNGESANILQKVTVPITSVEYCRAAYGQDAFGEEKILDSMICAGLDEGGRDSCQGDSGGPLVCGNQLTGIVSWGKGCALPGFPGVYTQTSYFIPWINSHL